MHLAFYKASGGIFDKAVRLVTRSAYSHVELVIGGKCYSSSIQDGGVRSKHINIWSGSWDVVEIGGDEAVAKAWFEQHDGQDYDWLGAFRFAIPFLRHRSGKWFCSEAVGAALGLPDAHKLTPQNMWEWSQRKT